MVSKNMKNGGKRKMDKRIYTPKEVQEILGIDTGTLYKYLNQIETEGKPFRVFRVGKKFVSQKNLLINILMGKGMINMKLWAILNKKYYQKLLQGISYRLWMEESPWKEETQKNITGLYYIMEKMYRQVGFPPTYNIIPIVTWHTYCGECRVPDMDEFLYLDKKDMVCLEVEVPDDQVVLIDALAYMSLMEGEYIPIAEDLETLEEELAEYENMGVVKRAYETRKSWKRVYDISHSAYILGVIWELKPEMVEKIVW